MNSNNHRKGKGLEIFQNQNSIYNKDVFGVITSFFGKVFFLIVTPPIYFRSIRFKQGNCNLLALLQHYLSLKFHKFV